MDIPHMDVESNGKLPHYSPKKKVMATHISRPTVSNLNIATWNVRSLAQSGKLDNIKQEMERMSVNILGMSEMRWTGAGEIQSDKFKVIYSGGQKHERGVGILLDTETGKTMKVLWQYQTG